MFINKVLNYFIIHKYPPRYLKKRNKHLKNKKNNKKSPEKIERKFSLCIISLFYSVEKGYFVYPLFSVIPSYKFVEEKKVREIQIYKGLDAR